MDSDFFYHRPILVALARPLYVQQIAVARRADEFQVTMRLPTAALE